jgi:hypothetical protein
LGQNNLGGPGERGLVGTDRDHRAEETQVPQEEAPEDEGVIGAI